MYQVVPDVAATTAIEVATDCVWAGVALSLTVTVKLNVPVAEGVPEIKPVVAAWVNLQRDSGSLAAGLTGYNESIAGERRWQDRNGKVATGIDVLEQDHFAELAALAARHGGTLRLGLLTNQTGDT